jgi:hypothetical protein
VQPHAVQHIAIAIINRNRVTVAGFEQFPRAPERFMFGPKLLDPSLYGPGRLSKAQHPGFVVTDTIGHALPQVVSPLPLNRMQHRSAAYNFWNQIKPIGSKSRPPIYAMIFVALVWRSDSVGKEDLRLQIHDTEYHVII